MAVYDNFKIYFDKVVKSYLPYKSNNTYQGLCAALRDPFFKDSYDTIPKDLQLYVENQKVTPPLYDNLLLSNGYPADIVSTILTEDKAKILNHLMHYQAINGTLNHWKKICQLFNEKIAVSELYAVYKKNKQHQMDWFMMANPIFNNISSEIELEYDYDEIYNATPTYFLSKLQLNQLLRDKSLVLPFKTNLVIIDSSEIIEYSMLDSIVSSVAYSYFQYEKIELALNQIHYSFTIGTLYQLWQYLSFFALGEVPGSDKGIDNLMFSVSQSPPYTLRPSAENCVKYLINEYDKITNKNDLYNWLTKVNIGYRSNLSDNQRLVSLNAIRINLSKQVPVSLISYFEQLIETSDNKRFGLDRCMTIIDECLTDFIDHELSGLAKEYEKWLRLPLAKQTTNIKNTTTYKLLLEFKPYHTQFILRAKLRLLSNDKTNMAKVEDHVYFVHHIYAHSGAVVGDSFELCKKYHFDFTLIYDDNTTNIECKKAGKLKIGQMLTATSESLQLLEGQCEKVQLIDIQQSQINVTSSQYYKIVNNDLNIYNPQLGKLLTKNSLISVGQLDEDFIKAITDLNNSLIIQLNLANEYLIDLKNNNQAEITKNQFEEYITNNFNVDNSIKDYLRSYYKVLPVNNSHNEEYFLIEDLLKDVNRLFEEYILLDETINEYKRILYEDNQCLLVFDRNWKCLSGTYDKLLVYDLPPVFELMDIEGAQWTFPNIISSCIVNCNEIAFNNTYIGDTIYLPEDKRSDGVKVIGKDLLGLNLLCDRHYTGTAGTFSKICRYRSGF